MDYEKAYKEALEQAKKELAVCGNMDYDAARLIFRLFPQLRENEDERIREELIGHCKDLVRMNRDDKVMLSIYEPWLDWLKKQKEHQENGITYGMKRYSSEKPAEWSEKHIADIFEKVGLAKIAREQGNDELTNALQDAMLELSKVENTEWSEEDEEMIGNIISSLRGYIHYVRENGNYNNHEAYIQKEIEFLNSLRPQPKQDVFPSLSEKEIICLKRALDYLRKEHNRYGGEDFTNEIAVLEWLITHPILVSDTHWNSCKQ